MGAYGSLGLLLPKPACPYFVSGWKNKGYQRILHLDLVLGQPVSA
jgi:hypothetical protein